jgi:phosphoribosylglycinamide formyltransferase-1
MSRSATDIRDQLHKVCLALPEAEASSRTGQHAKFTVRGRTFAYFLNDHHGDGRIAVSCKAAPGGREVLVGGDAERFFVAAYSSKDWVAMRLDLPRTDWAFVKDLVRDSYRMVAPKGLAREVDATASRAS